MHNRAVQSTASQTSRKQGVCISTAALCHSSSGNVRECSCGRRKCRTTKLLCARL